MDIPSDERSRSGAFIALLIEDVIAARQRLDAADTQAARRNVVRVSLAAIESMTWLAREHVRTALAELEHLTPVADLALRELSYTVSESGQLLEQPRGLPLLTAIRLVVSQAQIASPEIVVEFSRTGWHNLRQSISIRNRITHPKPDQDLAISDNDLAAVGSGLSWLVATFDYVMTSTNLAMTHYNAQLREIIERLSAGDTEALAAYQTALQQAEDD